MSKQYILYFFFLFSFSSICISQNKLFERYNDSANVNKIEHYAKAKMYADSAVIIAKQDNNIELIARAYNTVGNVEDAGRRYESAIENFKSAEKYAVLLSDKTILAKVYNNLGNCYGHLGNLDQSISKHLKALTIRKKLSDRREEAVSYENLGVVYFQLANYPMTIKYTNEAIRIADSIKDINFLGQLYGNLGAAYFSNYQDTLALTSYSLALKYSLQTNDDYSAATAYINLGNFHNETGNPSKAMQALKQALSLKNISKTDAFIQVNNNLGLAFESVGKADSALHYFNLALQHAQQSKNKLKIIDVYKNMQIFYQRHNDYKSAYELQEKQKQLKEEVLNEKNLKNIAELETVYKTEKQAQQIALLNSANETEKLHTKNRTRLLFISLISLVFACLAAIAFYRNYSQKKKDNLILQDKNEQIEHQKELIVEKQKEILDSITYAKRLQSAILPPASFIDKHLPNNFVLYKPKDIVAGDFYWMHMADGLIFIAAADSTGHGVPGAMVSIVCSNALDKAVKEFGLTDTGKILDKTRDIVLETFAHKEYAETGIREEIKDGMDISFLCIDRSNHKAYWSGANNKLWYISLSGDVVLNEIKPNKQPIGKTDDPQPFLTNEILLQEGMIFYLITDGFADQFGGERAKKFKYKPLEDFLLSNAHKPMIEQHELLDQKFEDWKGNLQQVDDVTIIGIKI